MSWHSDCKGRAVFTSLMQDLRFAVRQLWKSPGFTIVALVALALGIGANTAIFSVVYNVVLRPLPFPEQDRLLFVGEWSQQVPTMSVSYPNFVDWRARQQAFSALGAFRGQGFNYVGSHDTERVGGAMASADLFAALGMRPLRGRAFSAADDRPGAERTVILSEAAWQRWFGGREDVLGEKLRLSGDTYTVVGVMPAEFRFPSPQTDVWVPLGVFADQYEDRGSHPGIYCVARLKPGVSVATGVAELKGIAEQLAREYPTTNARQSAAVQPFSDRAFGTLRPALYVLLGAAGFVLLIACANVANLQLSRAYARSREFALRAALGASRATIVRQLLVESMVLGGLGCAAGVLLGVWGLDALRVVLPANIPRAGEIALNGPVLGFAVLASLATSVAFGLLPAWHASRHDLREAVANGQRATAGAGGRWRAALVMAEFGLTGVLLVGAGLMLRTLSHLYRADPGYDVENTTAFNWVLPGAAFVRTESRVPLLERAHAALATLPGVSSVALITPLPLSGGGNQTSYRVEGAPLPEVGRQPSTEYFQASGDVFAALRIPVLAGRPFGPQDTLSSRRVVVVDALFVEKNFPGQDPIGRRITLGQQGVVAGKDWAEIVGVVAHIQNYGPGQPTREQVYVPFTQSTPGAVTFVLRSDLPPDGLAPVIRHAMRAVDPELPVFGLQGIDRLFGNTIATQRLTLVLLGTFAGLALVLAAVGLYGVLAYSVAQRTREIGVRMALGATSAGVVRLVLRQGLAMAAVGLALGLVAALGLTRLLGAVLYRTSPLDPLSFAGVGILLSVVALVACWLPALRASRVAPTVALRAD